MAPRTAITSVPPAPDSPRSSQSPTPSGAQGDLELEFLGLATALYNLGTTVINDSTKERDKLGGSGKQVGPRVNEVVNHLATIDGIAQHTQTMIPLQILSDIDSSRNPMQLTKERLERAATENQFMNGKIAAIDSYRSYLDEALSQSFPQIGQHLGPSKDMSDTNKNQELTNGRMPRGKARRARVSDGSTSPFVKKMQPSSRPASTSTRPGASPLPRPVVHQVNTQTKLIDTIHGRILCIADIRGRLSGLNDLAREVNAKAIIHTGDFGFFEAASLDRINDRTLRHLTMYSPLIPGAQRTHLLAPENPPAVIRSTVNISLLSEFPLLLAGQIKLHVPVYTVWGACEDVIVLEKFRAGTYTIDNLHILDEATTRCLDIGGVKLRLLGLGGALVSHKIFDNGEGNATIAGGQGTMWTTALQIGELVDTAQRVFDQSETRLLVTHASPGREGIIAQLALVLKADLTISAGLHFRYASSYNEFSVQGDFDGFRHKLTVGKEGFDKVWESVKTQVDAVIDEHQRTLLDKALSVIERIPSAAQNAGTGAALTGEEPAWKNCWNWNLCDAAYGSLVLDIREGRISAELRSQGFNYAYRRTATSSTIALTPTSTSAALPALATTTHPPTKVPTPAPTDKPASSHNASKSNTSSPPPLISGKETPKDGAGASKPNGTSSGPPSDKTEKEKAKKKEKKERKERERTERETKEKEKESQNAEDKTEEAGPSGDARHSSPTPLTSGPKSGKATPEAPVVVDADGNSDLKSPTTESTGFRTPTSKRPQRNPWTIFIRMQVPVNETELRDFFGEAKGGITRVTYPPSFAGRNQKLAYVEFGDEEAMRVGLDKHAEKLKDTVPEVKQATDRESRVDGGGYRGGPPRGRGRGGGYVARGFAAAGLTSKGPGEKRTNGDPAPDRGGDAA